MAGGAAKYRHLSRKSSHRQALLRNLVTSLFKHESITTTWAKAKEAQRLAEKLITLGKKNTAASRQTALATFYTPHEILPKLFGPLRTRYANRPGGYTRVLRVEPKKDDAAESAVLELVDGPKDMRFAMTARTIARQRAQGFDTLNEITTQNVRKVTRFRENGVKVLEKAIRQLKLSGHGAEGAEAGAAPGAGATAKGRSGGGVSIKSIVEKNKKKGKKTA
ncbi:mitochondrial 54S ribosomal protein bL17m [Aspergillus homomorphus CBS 101889]|uniref:Large ribosomal subunit protein bL17m n=1 Tax=Aspergillus homomorphus (strain CBS 101889) TaxID=1450537 RepID=A0A395HNK0_ASPHC|nr:ribosomal protein L17 [Aspergillus homomorphus CBS 101889]RAL09330.1 ribosomal protein L17 [Aspergillus homomorphus CBS 101889]